MKKRLRLGRGQKLTKMVLIWQLTIGVTLAVITCIAVGLPYYHNAYKRICDTAYGFAETTADCIDASHIADYVQTLEKDDYYREIQQFINVVDEEQTSIDYIFVVVPQEDSWLYVWTSKDTRRGFKLGKAQPYSDESKKVLQWAFNNDPKPRMFSGPFGNFSAFYPIYSRHGEPVALVGVDLDLTKIRRSLLTTLILLIVSISLLTALFMVTSYRTFKRKIVQPITILQNGMRIYRENMDANEATTVLEGIPFFNEIGTLTGDLITLMVEIDDNTNEVAKLSAEKQRIETELNVATHIQADMLPQAFPAFPERKEFDLHASMSPAKEVGGDFYDFFLVDDDHLALVMADVSGKGVPAALFMVVAMTLIKNRAQMILSDVNNQLCAENKNGMFVTVWLAILEISTGKGLAANAGHEHPVLRRAGGSYELVEYRHSPVVAFMKGIRFEEHPFQMFPGDRLLVYTDGVPEATNAQTEMFGCKRMVDALNAAGDQPPRETLLALKRSIDEFVGSAPQFDDITMLCLDYFGTDPGSPDA